MKIIIHLITIALTLISTNLRAADSRFDCDDLGSLVDQGGVPEKTALWKLGPAPGYERTFTVAWDMYGIPDRIVIEYRDANGKQTFESGLVSNTSSHTFKLTANGSQDVKITLNPGDGLSGTAWEYRMFQDGLNIEDLSLTSYTGPDVWRRLVTGTNLSDESPIVFDVFGPDAITQTSPFIAKVYRVTIPNGTKAVRVRAESGVQICMLKGCIPRPGQLVPGRSSKNRYQRNSIILNESTTPVEPGVHYITVSISRRLAQSLMGLGSGGSTLALGPVSIDCFQTGVWNTATHKTTITRETESVLVGFESTSGQLEPDAGAITIVSHGRADSPAGMTTLANAAVSRWSRKAHYLNWSDASNSNPLGLDGTRFITSASARLATLLRKYGIRGTTAIDFLGHSWGTYIGYSLSGNTGKFRRFFALDPAQAGFQYNYLRVNFRKAAAYSLAIFGNGLYGNTGLAITAHDAAVLDPPLLTLPGTRHTEPVTLMAGILANQSIIQVQSAFAHALGQNGGAWNSRPWDLDRYNHELSTGFLAPLRGYETVLATDGNGNVSNIRYFDKVDDDIELDLP